MGDTILNRGEHLCGERCMEEGRATFRLAPMLAEGLSWPAENIYRTDGWMDGWSGVTPRADRDQTLC